MNMVDYRQSEEFCQYSCKRGWKLEQLGSTRILIKKLFFFGTVIKIQRGAADINLDELNKLAFKNKALFIVMEPDITTNDPEYNNIEKRLDLDDYHNIKMYLSFTKTSYIDLTRTEQQILASFDQDIRKILSNNEKSKIVFKRTHEIEKIYKMVKEAGHTKHYFVQAKKAWRDQWEPFKEKSCTIYAYLSQELLGANMFVCANAVASGLYLPVTQRGRNLHVAASLIWEGIQWAKAMGCSTFDLNGMFDQRYLLPKRWQGFSAFKKKFRGTEVEFMHPKVKVFSPAFKVIETLGLLWVFFPEG